MAGRMLNSWDMPSRAELMRLAHERWLDRAIRSGKRYPTIPTRAVRDGGFSAVMGTPEGREDAARWWSGVLEVVDEAE